MSTFDYKILEQRLRDALALVRQQFNLAQVQEVEGFLDIGEYGLAFESLLYFIVEANANVTTQLCAVIKDAAHRMNYNKNVSELQNSEVAAVFALILEACSKCSP